MVKIIFVCEGNICRSPSAEFIFRNMLRASGAEKSFEVCSRGTLGNTVGRSFDPRAMALLAKNGIPYENRKAQQITKKEFDAADYVIVMDNSNIVRLRRLLFIRSQSRIHLLSSFEGKTAEIEDPYYTLNFDKAYADITSGCRGLLEFFRKDGSLL